MTGATHEFSEAAFGVVGGSPLLVGGDNAVARFPDGDAAVGLTPFGTPVGKSKPEVFVGCEAWGSLPGLATGPGSAVGDADTVTAGPEVTEGTPPLDDESAVSGSGAAAWESLSSEAPVFASGSVGVAESTTIDTVWMGMSVEESLSDGGSEGSSSPEMAELDDWSVEGDPSLSCGFGDWD